jgi:hypothetical protein
MELDLRKITAIPLSVVLKRSPGSWELKSDEKANGNGLAGASTRYVLKDRYKYNRKANVDDPFAFCLEGWVVRDRFMSIRTEQQVLEFLNEHGEFSSHGKDDSLGLSLQDVQVWQKIFAKLVRRQPDRWNQYVHEVLSTQLQPHDWIPIFLGSRHRVEFQWHRAKYIALLRTFDVVSTIVATIQVDHLRGAKFGACARADCPKFFEFTTGHKRKYCGQYCAHFASLRRMRKKQQQLRKKQQQSDRGRKQAGGHRHPSGGK